MTGIFVYDKEHKISQYADDSASSLFNALKTLESKERYNHF